MLQFETLLLRQLQRQQSRAEFCDTVLQSQGVSVPVHSCVLSAFSPWLCGALSSMPAPLAGQRRLIELQRVEACTLLSLVSLLYSGQLDGNREDVLSAAELLGIKLPEEYAEERRGGKERMGNKSANAEQQKESLSHGAVGQHNDKIEKSGKEESGTQTERERVRDERETQTDHICSDPQQNSHATCSSSSHEQATHTSATDATVMLLGTHVSPEKKSSTCDALGVAPETGYLTVSEAAYVSQFCLYPPESSYYQPAPSVTPYPSVSRNYMELGHVQSKGRGVSGGMDDIVEDFKQFEGNIPGFISYFLDPAHSPSSRRRGRGRPRGSGRGRGGARGEGMVRKTRVRSRGEGTVRGRGGRRERGRQRQSRMERWGWGPRLAWRGQGGGRVGRKLDIRPTGKQLLVLTRRRRGRGAMLEVGEGRGRGRQRQRGRRGAHAVSEGQDATPCSSSLRGPPPLCPLALSPCSSSLLHTVSLPPAPQVSTPPMDMFLDDFMAGLNFLPPVSTENQTSQHEFVNTSIPSIPSISKTTYPSMGSSVKPTDVSQQQPEGELCDILDHFLNTFEQHSGGCDLGVEEQTSNNQPNPYTATRSSGAQVNRDPSNDSCSNVYTQLQPLNPQLVHCHVPHASISPHCTQASNAPQPVRTSSANTSLFQAHLQPALRQSTPWYRGSKERLEVGETEITDQRMTRSQSRKRKLRTALTSPQSPKRKRSEKQRAMPVALTKKKRPQVRRPHRRQKRPRRRVGLCVSAGGVSKGEAGKVNTTQTWSIKDTENNTTQSLNKERHFETGVDENRHKTNGHGEGSNVETGLIAASSWTSQTPVKKNMGRAYIKMASSAFEKMRMLLEEQRQRQEQQLRAEKSEMMCKENKHVRSMKVQESLSVAEDTSHDHSGKSREAFSAEESTMEGKERTVCAETEALEEASGTGETRCRQEMEQNLAVGQDEVMTNKCSTLSQVDLLPNADFGKSTREEESDCNNNEPMLITAASPKSTLDLLSSDPVSAKVLHSPHGHQVLTPSASSQKIKITDFTLGSDERTPTTLAEKFQFLSHAPIRHELFPSNTLNKDMPESAGSSEEEEDVDILEVSSTTSEQMVLPDVMWGLSTGEEDLEVDTDEDVDVLGVESD